MPCVRIHIGRIVMFTTKKAHACTKNPTTTTTLPSPRATRAKSIKRHVENEAEERGGEE